MNRLTRIFALALMLTLGLSPVARADDALDVKSATLKLYERLNANDPEGMAAFFNAGGFSEFTTEGTRSQMTTEVFRQIGKSGVKLDLTVAELDVKLLGNVAIATGYRVGTITPPGVAPIKTRFCMTMVWQKSANGWKLQHAHFSPPAA